MLIVNDDNRRDVTDKFSSNEIYDWRYSLKDSCKGLLGVFIFVALLAAVVNFLPSYLDEITGFFSQAMLVITMLFGIGMWLLKWICIIVGVLYFLYVAGLIITALEKYVSTN